MNVFRLPVTRVVCTGCRSALRIAKVTVSISRRGATYRFLSTDSIAEKIQENADEVVDSETLPNNYCPKKLSYEDLLRLSQKFEFAPATKPNNKVTLDDINRKVTLHGWLIIPGRRLSKSHQFFQLRDAEGTVLQLSAYNIILPSNVTTETPVAVTGTLDLRPEAARREGLGQFELKVDKIYPLNSVSFTLPFQPSDPATVDRVNHVTRAKYRYLELRSQLNHGHLRLRDDIIASCRQILRKDGFMEIETPLLFKSTPEGAREFIVPTRRKGEVYALPQSPQQYKQILMASGVAKYFQVAKCFRDEDLRADRQPEFTQLDLEMAFSRSEDVMSVIEQLVTKIWNRVFPGSVDTHKPFLRMTYQEAMSKYGCDKPDTRFGCEIKDISKFVDTRQVYVFVVPRGTPMANKVRKDLCVEAMGDFETENTMFPSVYSNSGTDRWIDKIPFVTSPVNDRAYFEMNKFLELRDGDMVFAGIRPKTFTGGTDMMGRARILCFPYLLQNAQFKLPPFQFLWVTDFPLFSPDLYDTTEPGQGGLAGLRSTHHPFTAPKVEDLKYLQRSPLHVKGQHYDLVVNGIELGGGSVRIHDADLQHYVLKEVLRLPDNRLNEFNHLLEALASGCPPHAGIALGLDRMISLLGGTKSIRDVIAFPKMASGTDAVVGSPSKVDEDILSEYHLRITPRAIA